MLVLKVFTTFVQTKISLFAYFGYWILFRSNTLLHIFKVITNDCYNEREKIVFEENVSDSLKMVNLNFVSYA